jgi:uncharacterized protein YkwD
MTWKTVFSGIAMIAFPGVFLLAALSAPAQRVRISKSATGRVVSRQKTSDRFYNRQESRGNLSNDEMQIHYLVNNERRRKGLNDLYWDDELARMARAYSRQMARESFFSHYDPDGDSVVERARRSDIGGWSKIGENLFRCEGYDDFDALAVRGWMSSPTHRQNVLDRQFNTTGIGVATTRDGEVFITQVFTRN